MFGKSNNRQTKTTSITSSNFNSAICTTRNWILRASVLLPSHLSPSPAAPAAPPLRVRVLRALRVLRVAPAPVAVCAPERLERGSAWESGRTPWWPWFAESREENCQNLHPCIQGTLGDSLVHEASDAVTSGMDTLRYGRIEFTCQLDWCIFRKLPNWIIELDINIHTYIYAQTGTFADPTVGRFELFFPFEAGVRFFFGFQEAFSSCGYITGLDMCKVYTEAVHSVAL